MRFFALAACAFVACSVFACSDDPGPPPQVFLFATIGPGTEKDADGKGINDQAKCQLPTEVWLDLGKNDALLASGTKQGESGVSVTCIAKPEGSGIRVTAAASLERRGSFTVTGLFTGTGEQKNITATFRRGDTGGFRQKDCTVEYGNGMGVSAGRVWGNLRCPRAEFTDGQDRTCLGVAEFRFENCDK